MRGFLLKGFFRCKTLSPAHNGWTRKRRKLILTPGVKSERLVTAALPQQALFLGGEDAEDSGKGSEALNAGGIHVDLKVPEVDMQDKQSDEEEEADGGHGPADVGKENPDVALIPNEDVPSASQGREKSSLYPSVSYDGKTATVSLGIGQTVILDGCAMVQVVEGQASMLGYFLPCGVDVLVCSSSKLSEAVSFDARHTLGEGRPEGRNKKPGSSYHMAEVGDMTTDGSGEGRRGQDSLGCRLRFTSHKLGNQTNDAAADKKLTFKLEIIGPLGRCLGRKRGRDVVEEPDQDTGDNNEVDSDEEENDSDVESSDSDGEDRDDRKKALKGNLTQKDAESLISTESLKKRKSSGPLVSNVKRQRVGLSDSSSSATSVPHEWREAVEAIMLKQGTQLTRPANGSHTTSCAVVAICGARNVGKSTFARFLVNSLLNRHKEVAYLDTDVGQPEFTVPGCISLHILDQPIVGPPAMHLRTPERCLFYGDISPKSDPMMYSQNVATLYNHFCEQYCHIGKKTIPLVINTHGWVKGVGYEVIVDILGCTSPTHVVQLLADSEKKNLPRGRFWDESSTAETLYVESAVENLTMHKSGRAAHHLRAARVLAYFQQCSGDNPAPFPYREAKLFAETAMSLVSQAPYQVPITALKIKHLHLEVPPSESLRTVNAALVGLGVSSANEVETPLSPLCIGVGIVRAVDVQKGVFHISTPVPMEQLQQVDTLLQGRVEIPAPLLMAKGYMCPYFCRESLVVEGVGAAAMKSACNQMAKKAA